ncbi:carbohydrate ABC transporter permease [Massiliimalia timonensis]|uniref:carbohydrate ABC transporter permease n=1 Tax=Massiliimalia timonensis TaxID=1987501 RepID=UPI0018A05195|nr:carbohydrate ABC transporter permease [Massiliimalia timonensis]
MSKKSRRFLNGLRHWVVMIFTTFFVLFPFYWMVMTSLKPREELMASPPKWIPSYLDFNNYKLVWEQMPLLRYLGNSLFVSLMTTIVCLVLATFCGYSISRFVIRKTQKFTSIMMIISQLIPGTLPFISFYFIMYNAHLTNTYQGLVIAYSVWAIPFCTLMMKSYFSQAVPIALEESATLDGCSKFGIFFRIALPISVPGLVATAIFAFIQGWNEFMWASVMLSNNDMKPASVGIYDFIGQYGANSNVSLSMTAAVMITLPAIIFFAFLQKYLISGLSAGAVKG